MSFDEFYALLNTGAELIGGFSRFDYQIVPASQPTPSFRSLKASLPKDAQGAYYRLGGRVRVWVCARVKVKG